MALSSGEAEYYALVKTAAEALGVQALAADLGWSMRVRIFLDSSAAKAMASRVGLGRVRHLEVRYLWVQQSVKRGRLQIVKINGKVNPADIATKPKNSTEMQEQASRIGGRIVLRD